MQQDPTYWTDVEDIFASAVDLTPGRRAGFLDERCGRRDELRSEVESLLAAHESADSFLQWPPVPGCASAGYGDVRTGDILGGWRLVETIGSGGMSEVYRAERADGAFPHQVALKMIHAPVRSREVSRRFAAERQILGALHHPHIVALIDGGTSPQGHAYLVMELVEGIPLTQYAREQRLGLEDRLRLFTQVCAAVQYAHQNSIVHRDLKPGNILVTADGLPKVLDFGVAKLLTAPPGTESATAPGVLTGPLTPNYASPEQLRGLPVTTASDIYALGVLLYELIAGTRPYDTTGQPLDEVLAIVLGSTKRPSAAIYRGDVPELPYPRSRLRGDLDAIAQRAMAREPEERYASASELAQDLARVLEGRAVLAREPSAGYLFRRFAVRHKAVVVSGAIALSGILGALGIALWQARIAERERARAEQRSTEVRQLANALIFKIHEAVVGVPGTTQVRQLILQEALNYLEGLAREAGGDTTAALDLARAYVQLGALQGAPVTSNLGDRGAAIASYNRGIALLEPLAQGSSATPELLHELSTLLAHRSHALVALQGRSVEAEQSARQALAVASGLRVQRPDDDGVKQLVANAHYQLALALHSSETEQHLRAALDLLHPWLARAPGDGDRLVSTAIVEWALAGHLRVTPPLDRRAGASRTDPNALRAVHHLPGTFAAGSGIARFGAQRDWLRVLSSRRTRRRIGGLPRQHRDALGHRGAGRGQRFDVAHSGRHSRLTGPRLRGHGPARGSPARGPGRSGDSRTPPSAHPPDIIPRRRRGSLSTPRPAPARGGRPLARVSEPRSSDCYIRSGYP